MSGTGRYLVGIDVGGTFTDVFVLDREEGTCRTAKVPSRRDDQAEGILAGLAAGSVGLADILTVIHGTTVGTNALLERKGARTGVITTRGFRDVLEMRRRDRPRTWGLWGTFEPVVPRDLRLEVDERTLADGTVRRPVDPEAVKVAARALHERGVEAVCVFFVNAYANDANERAALAAVREVWPNEFVVASSEILPEIREFERASTAALNAYLQPVVGTYLETLERRLRTGGFHGQVLIVQSNGGVMAVETARRLPVRTALSGPAAGVIAGGHIARVAGYANVITCDMGGTSFDVSVIADGATVLAPQTSVDFGLVVRTPMIEITTIGAGGGSIARVDAGGLLQVGPESAGAEPGPACYGLGNDRPTVTDANLLLGRIDADHPIGGRLARLDLDAAAEAVEAHVARPLGLDRMTAAEAIIRVANSRMAGAIRLVSIERGHDPKRFVAMPFGGGGALHTGALIKEVGLDRALVPRFPGVTSALGCIVADLRHDFVHTVNRTLDELDTDALGLEMERMAEQGRALLARAGDLFDAVSIEYEFDMAYVGQTHTVAVPFAPAPAGGRVAITVEDVRAAFETRYAEVYGRPLEGIVIRLLNLRTAVVGRRPKFDLAVLAPKAGARLEDALRGTRPVWIDGAWREAAVYARLELPVGAVVPGPAVLEQPDATTFVEPDLYGEVDRFGNLVVARKEAE